MFFDTHAHLNNELLKDELQNILGSFNENGVDTVIEVGYDIESSKKAIELAEKNSNIYAAIGIHPEECENTKNDDYTQLIELSKSKKVVAIGEIGLDYHYDYPKELQKEVFIRQIKLANQLNLPVIIHLRDAYQDMTEILFKNIEYLNNGLLFHCYSGSKEMVKVFEKLDPYYAFGGAITFKKNNRADAIKAVKKDRLLLETDCPYMTPEPFRGKVNNSNLILHVAERMADILELTIEETANFTSENAKRFFKIKN